MEALIEKHSQPKDLIVDPFAGSGTTALASLKLKRQFIGGDKDSSYIKKARKRIKTETNKKNFIPRASKNYIKSQRKHKIEKGPYSFKKSGNGCPLSRA